MKKILAAGFMLLLSGAVYYSLPKEKTEPLPAIGENRIASEKPIFSCEREEILIGTARLCAEVSDTAKKREQGLSGRENLKEGEGMLFVFERPGRYGFWMKEMNFSIDMIWIDADKKIIAIEENVAPETYPKIYQPKTDILYVLEVPAGFSLRQNLKPGDNLTIPSQESLPDAL